MQRALNEAHEMASNAVARISRGDPSTIHLLETLFGRDPARYHTVSGYLASFTHNFPTSDFVVICDDLMVNLEPDLLYHDPRGRWHDPVHAWYYAYDMFRPCDPLRKPGSRRLKGYIIAYRYIYVCPEVLDLPKGRSLAPYKDRVLAGKWINDYRLITPLHGTVVDEELRRYPPVHLASDPAYLNTLLIVETYAFSNCRQLAYESPDLAVQNADSVALCALGKPDSNLAKHHQKEENLLIRLDSRSLLV
ncbi:hypothetical protein MMC22_007538 [Lobaria immixta]|nr:hypothetical protein [Lobaria immixta]